MHVIASHHYTQNSDLHGCDLEDFFVLEDGQIMSYDNFLVSNDK